MVYKSKGRDAFLRIRRETLKLEAIDTRMPAEKLEHAIKRVGTVHWQNLPEDKHVSAPCPAHQR